MASRPPCLTPRPRRRAPSTSGPRRWPRPTKRASRSARKVSGLTREGRRGGIPAARFFGVFLRPGARSAYSCMRPKPALRSELLFYLSFLAAFALLVGVATSLLALALAPDQGVAMIVILVVLEVAIFILYGQDHRSEEHTSELQSPCNL